MIPFPALTEHVIESTAAVFLEHAPRALVSAYPFCIGIRPIRNLLWFAKNFGDRQVILDSGLFTFFRDTEVHGKKVTSEIFDAYFSRYTKILRLIPKHWIIVEFDTHAMGHPVEPYREVLAKNGWEDRALHVWHIEEGMPAFVDYVKRFKRVAFSQVGLDRGGSGSSAIPAMLRSIKDLRKGKHIHVLGSTADRLFPQCDDGFSADSTTWTNIAIYGETRGGAARAKYDSRTKKVTAPESIMEIVHRSMPHMMDWYRKHPEHTLTRNIRVNYLRQLSAGLLVWRDHVDRLRSRAPGYDPTVQDPVKFWESTHASRAQSPSNEDQDHRRESGEGRKGRRGKADRHRT